MRDNLPERLQSLADALEEAIDHIATLEAILQSVEETHPEAVDEARARVAAAMKTQHG